MKKARMKSAIMRDVYLLPVIVARQAASQKSLFLGGLFV